MRKIDIILCTWFSELIQDTHLTTNSWLLETAKDHSFCAIVSRQWYMDEDTSLGGSSISIYSIILLTSDLKLLIFLWSATIIPRKKMQIKSHQILLNGTWYNKMFKLTYNQSNANRNEIVSATRFTNMLKLEKLGKCDKMDTPFIIDRSIN